jgi:hypothetical protein
LEQPAYLTLKLALRKIHAVSTYLSDYGKQTLSRADLAISSPFHFDERTTTRPIVLAEWSECREVLDEKCRPVGFVSFDADNIETGDLFCAHISTLRDNATNEALKEFDDPSVMQVDRRKYQLPILANALVLTRLESGDNHFRRLGFAEVNYDWMSIGEKTVVKIY